MINLLKNEISSLKSYMINARRWLHQIPEAGMEEYKTSSFIKEELKKYGIRFEAVGETGVLAFVGDIDRKGCSALRADMDALNIYERRESSYASKHEGMMHACGHDGHIAALLGALRVIKAHEDMLDCGVKAIFQPSEEDCRGASYMISKGVLENVAAIFGAHIFTDIDHGLVSIEPYERMAVSLNFELKFHGRSGHAAKPHLCADATLAASAFVVNVQSAVSRMKDPLEPAVVTVGTFDSGTAHNVISGFARLTGTIRFFDSKTGEALKGSVRLIADQVSSMYGCEVEIIFKNSAHPTVYNDPGLTGELKNAASLILDGEKDESRMANIVNTPPILLGEDFSNYQRIIPGVFAFVGGYNESKGCIYPNHHDKFEFDEDALVSAAALHVAFVFRKML